MDFIQNFSFQLKFDFSNFLNFASFLFLIFYVFSFFLIDVLNSMLENFEV